MIDLNQYLDPVCLDKPEVEHLTGSAAFPHNVVVNTGNVPLEDLYRLRGGTYRCS